MAAFRLAARAAAALLAAALALAAGPVAVAAGPKLDAPRSGPCVEDPKLMRRSHMEFLKHDRDDTVRRGVRPAKHSLAGCVSCHASRADDSVLGSDTHFCQGCHVYAAVKLDCFECHTPKARPAAVASAAGEPLR